MAARDACEAGWERIPAARGDQQDIHTHPILLLAHPHSPSLFCPVLLSDCFSPSFCFCLCLSASICFICLPLRMFPCRLAAVFCVLSAYLCLSLNARLARSLSLSLSISISLISLLSLPLSLPLSLSSHCLCPFLYLSAPSLCPSPWSIIASVAFRTRLTKASVLGAS